MSRFLWIIFLFASTCAAQLCPFSNGTSSNETLKEEFAPSTFTVGEVGTAYLVDADQGYLLTANHVLEQLAVAHKPFEIWYAAPDTSTPKRYGFTIKKQMAELDLALIKINDPIPTSFHQLRPLDISFKLPDADTHLFAMGYPNYGGQAQVFFRSGEAKLNSLTPGQMLEVEQLAEGGNSGGPLLNDNGYVIGTCEEETEKNKIGRYLPMVRSTPIFSEMPVSRRMLEIESQLEAKQLNEDDLKHLLQHRSDSPTNLELYLWSKRVVSSPVLTALIKPHLQCPLIPALVARGLLEVAYLYWPVAGASAKVAISLGMGEQEFKLGRDATALEFAKNASELASQAGDVDEKVAALLLEGRVQERSGFLDASRSAYTQAVVAATSPVMTEQASSMLPEALLGLARVEVQLGDGKDAIANYQKALNIYARGDGKQGQHDTLVALAELQARKGRYREAEDFLNRAIAVTSEPTLKASSLYQLGSIQLEQGQTAEAVGNFQKAISLAPGSQIASDSANALAAAQVLDSKHSIDWAGPSPLDEQKIKQQQF
jgi:tetratricopeptide (TPR) repeat protein